MASPCEEISESHIKIPELSNDGVELIPTEKRNHIMNDKRKESILKITEFSSGGVELSESISQTELATIQELAIIQELSSEPPTIQELSSEPSSRKRKLDEEENSVDRDRGEPEDPDRVFLMSLEPDLKRLKPNCKRDLYLVIQHAVRLYTDADARGKIIDLTPYLGKDGEEDPSETEAEWAVDSDNCPHVDSEDVEESEEKASDDDYEEERESSEEEEEISEEIDSEEIDSE